MKRTNAYAIVSLYKDFLAYSTLELKKIGINYGQLPFILYVGTRPNCTQADLKNDLHMDWGHCQRSVAKLVEEGFIAKENLENNQHKYSLSLTPPGQRVFDLSHEVFQTWDEERLKALDEKERAELFMLLHKLMPDDFPVDDEIL